MIEGLPYVRIVTINYDGGDITLRCLRSLSELHYPKDRFEIVLVDNGSIDGIVWKIRTYFPDVKIVELLTNEGFARGNNVALRELSGVDVVALVNNDAVVEPHWLEEMVAHLEAESDIGAVTSKMLFNREVVGVQFSVSDGTLNLVDIRLDEALVWSDVVHDERWKVVHDRAQAHETFMSMRGTASFAIPVEAGKDEHDVSVEVVLTENALVSVQTRDYQKSFSLVAGRHDLSFRASADCRIINNAGGGLFEGFFGGDIGFKEVDFGQYEVERDVFSFCGGAAAMKSEFLLDVGLFDPTFFLYYEDLDLSWRAHYRGWRIRYVPTAIAFHEHAYSSGEWSDFFRFWVDRNRRLTLIKNAPTRTAVKALFGSLCWGIRDAFLPVVKACLHLKRPPWRASAYRLRQLASFLSVVPKAYLSRRRQIKANGVDPDFVFKWLSTRYDQATAYCTHERCP